VELWGDDVTSRGVGGLAKRADGLEADKIDDHYYYYFLLRFALRQAGHSIAIYKGSRTM
jgi:hypothetical protein